MKKITLLAASALMSATVMASDLPQLSNSELATTNVTVGSVEINGVKFNKVVSNSALVNNTMMSQRSFQPGLYQGDLLQRNKISAVERVSGNLLISTSNMSKLQALAKAHNLEVHSTYGNIAILKAPLGSELLSTMSALRAADAQTGTVKRINLERISNTLRPE